jgi:4,5:9,10-diseco-3-hydroxy-5,9,17-trioxoandrosta-1(10),2-diene-4-oate hydrolase
MLHGGGPGASSWSNFGPALPGFAASFRTLLVDQPGFGQSDKPEVTANYFRFSSEFVVRLMDFAADPSREALRTFISTMVVDQRLVTDELVEERFADATAPGAREAMASMGASFWNPDWAEDGMLWREVHRLRHRVLLTWGREDRVNPLDGALVALKQIPNAQLHVFPRCGHWAQLEATDDFRNVTTTFLAPHRETQ